MGPAEQAARTGCGNGGRRPGAGRKSGEAWKGRARLKVEWERQHPITEEDVPVKSYSDEHLADEAVRAIVHVLRDRSTEARTRLVSAGMLLDQIRGRPVQRQIVATASAPVSIAINIGGLGGVTVRGSLAELSEGTAQLAECAAHEAGQLLEAQPTVSSTVLVGTREDK